MRVGVISDTHGLLRPEALAALHGVDRILHGGDIGKPGIVEALQRIAPVSAIRGNVDTGPWAAAFPETLEILLSGHRIWMLHDLETLDLDPVARGLSVVISGHSHKPGVEWRDPVLFLNPGSAGPRRFRLPVTLALLDLGAEAPTAKIVALPI